MTPFILSPFLSVSEGKTDPVINFPIPLRNNFFKTYLFVLGQCYHKSAACSVGWVDGERAAQQLSRTSRHRKSQSHALYKGVNLVKSLEHALLLVVRYAFTRIFNFYFQLSLF